MYARIRGSPFFHAHRRHGVQYYAVAMFPTSFDGSRTGQETTG